MLPTLAFRKGQRKAAKCRYLQKGTAHSKQRWRTLCHRVSESYEEAELESAGQQNTPQRMWKIIGSDPRQNTF